MSSTRSTLTSAHHGHGYARRRPSCDHDVVDCYGGQLERRLKDLEQHWVACKIARSPAPSHRRSRSDTTTAAGMPYSCVVTGAGAGAGPETPGFSMPVFRCSPRKLLCSLQQASSSGSSTASAGAYVAVKDGKGRRIRRREEYASSVCSVDAGSLTAAVAMTSSSCSCKCTIPLCGCGSGYSSHSGSTAATSLFSPGDQEAAVREVRKREGRWAIGSAGWFAAAGVVLVLGAMAILEFGMEDGHVEFLVPT